MGYDLFHDQAWGDATVKTRVFVSGPEDNPNREMSFAIELGDGDGGTVAILRERAGNGMPKFRELMFELKSAIEFAETGDVTDGDS